MRIRILAILSLFMVTGCATVPMEDTGRDGIAKLFKVPEEKAGVYIYRNEILGSAVRMDVLVNGRSAGETVAKTYLFLEVTPGTYNIESRAENADTLTLDLGPKSLTYVWQEVRMGVLYARTKLHVVSESVGKNGVLQSKLATSNVNLPQNASPPKLKPTSESGTGFAINSPNTLVTAYHVIERAKSLFVTCPNGLTATALTVKVDPANDLALLQLSQPAPAFLELSADNSVSIGQKAFTIGFPAPGILGPEPKYSDGSISSLSGIAGAANLLQMTVAIQPGNSGGPVADEGGHVIGVVTSTAAFQAFFRLTGALPQNVNWAVRSEYLRPLLSGVPVQTTSQSLPPIEKVKQSTCLVVAQGE